MSEAFAREILRRNVAQICQTIGWNGINSTPLDILVHILEKYIRTLATQANNYAEQFNRTEPNLNDLGLVFRHLHVQLPELVEYTRSVPPIPAPVNVDSFPKPKESNLNFLKPGSHEVVTRPMHVHEHLPPMYPEKERETPIVADTVEIRQNGIDSITSGACNSPEISVTDSPEKPKDLFKRPIDPVSLPNSKRPRLRLEEEERTREICSVMMTMSGFLSPAREGKLPEAKAPIIISEKHDKHKTNHSNLLKSPIHSILDKTDKKSKKNKMLNGKVMKSKRKDKSHKSEGKSKDGKTDRHPMGHPSRNKEAHPLTQNHTTTPAPKVTAPTSKSMLPPPVPPVLDTVRPIIKQEPLDLPPPPINRILNAEDAIPVPRKIPISKSPLVVNSTKHNVTNSFTDFSIKKEIVDDEEKLASQPDRSKVNIFKRITNKSKEDKNSSDVLQEKNHQNASISRLSNAESAMDSYGHVKVKSEDSFVNNNDSALDLSKDIDLTTNEVISLEDDDLDMVPAPHVRQVLNITHQSPLTNRSLHLPYPKEMAGVISKAKKDKKHNKEKKAAEKAAKLEAKLIKKQQQQLALEMARKQGIKLPKNKSPKLGRPKNDTKLPQMPPGFPFFPNMPPRGMMPGPGLIPNTGLIPGGDFLSGFQNPALRGLAPPNLLANPFSLGTSGPGLIPGPSFLPGSLGPGMPNALLSMGNFPHSSRSSTSKFPPMLRRPSLEVIPVENDNDRGMLKSPGILRDSHHHDKHKSPTIPNILQRHKKSHKDKSSLYKMPPVQPDITIELNPPKEPERKEPVCVEPILVRSPTPPEPVHEPIHTPIQSEPDLSLTEDSEKKKDKIHKKEKKDKDGIKTKKKKDKKEKNKEKSEKKKDKEDKQELKDKIKKEKKEKKKEKLVTAVDGLVPKITLKIGSSSPMPPSSPDVFKLNIKPVVKKEEDESPSPIKEEDGSREHSPSPELAQFSALVTRPPKQKPSKHNHTSEVEAKSPPPPVASPSRKNRPPSSKYKRILFKSMAKKGHGEHFDDNIESISEEPPPSSNPPSVIPAGPLPTPFYVDGQGNKIWVCPACGKPDNGSPMIGCDGCDGWYHWVCVGITEEPGATEDWFCKSCTAKRAAMVLAGVTTGTKKRGRKPKGEKVRDCN